MGKRRKRRGKRQPNQAQAKMMKKSAEKNVKEKETEKMLKSVPKVLVFRKRKRNIGKNLESMIDNLRKMFSPFTPRNLKIQNKTTMKHLVEISKSYYVSDFLVINLTETGPRLRMLHLPNGPTMVFRMKSYSLIEDVSKFYGSVGLKYDQSFQKYQTPATVLFKNFDRPEGGKERPMWLKLVRTGLEGLFPNPLELANNEPKKLKRCVLFSYDEESNLIDMRHYQINVSKPEKEKEMVDEDEEEEEGENEGMEDEDEDGKKNKTTVGLSEIGPRLRLQLEKIEEGFSGGEVIYHAFVEKSEAEINEQRRKINEKIQRRKTQEENVEKKLEKKREKKMRKKERLNKRKREALEELDRRIVEEGEGAESVMFDEDDEKDTEEGKRKKKKRKLE